MNAGDACLKSWEQSESSQQGEALPDDTPEKVPDRARGARPPLAAGDSEAPGVPVVLSLAALVLRSVGSCRHAQYRLQSGNVAMPSMQCLGTCCLPWPACLLLLPGCMVHQPSRLKHTYLSFMLWEPDCNGRSTRLQVWRRG